MSEPDKQDEVTRLRRENEALRIELERQWWHNHVEHCDVWPCSGICRWPRPDILIFDDAESANT